MTKKHFEAIAEAVRFLNLDIEDRLHVASEMAGVCQRFNSNFDRDRFIEAATRPTAMDAKRAR